MSEDVCSCHEPAVPVSEHVPAPISNRSLQAAEAVLAAINAQPRTPTREELASILEPFCTVPLPVWGVDPGSPDGDKTAAVVREGKELRMATTEEWWRLRALI